MRIVIIINALEDQSYDWLKLNTFLTLLVNIKYINEKSKESFV